MFYVFLIGLIGSFFIERKKLMKRKINLVLFISLSIIGITLGIIHMVSPYLPTVASLVEKYMK